MQPSVGLPPPLQNANKILPPAQGGVMAQMRRIFYCRINLAILLIGRHVATMLPQAAHRRATLAARCAQPPLNAIGTWDGRSQRNGRSEEHTSELQSLRHLVCRLLLEKKK